MGQFDSLLQDLLPDAPAGDCVGGMGGRLSVSLFGWSGQAVLGSIVAKTDATGRISLALRSKADKRFASPDGKTVSLVCCAELHHFLNDNLPPYGPKSGHGWLPRDKRFTKYGSKSCKEGAAVIEKEFGRQCLFLTGTVPGSGLEVVRTIAAYSSYIVSRVNQWLRNNAEDVHFVWVWEYQKRGALHNHVLVAATSRQQLASITERWHSFWIRLLKQVSRRARVDVFARDEDHSWWYQPEVVRTEAEWVKKSVARYISKYISKRACKVNNELFYNPAAWWGMSQNLRVKVQAARVRIETRGFNWDGVRFAFESLAASVIATASSVFRVSNPVYVCDVGLIAFFDDGSGQTVFDGLVQALYKLDPIGGAIEYAMRILEGRVVDLSG